MSKTSIEWTTDSWQVTAGCTRISPGCTHCYAETMAGRLASMAQKDLNDGRDPRSKRVYLDVVNQGKSGLNGYGPKSGWNRKVVTLPDNLEQPLRWKKPRRIFVDSMSDLFHADVPFEFIDLVFGAMAQAHWHTFQVLTKRTERMAEYFNSRDSHLAITRCFRNFVDYDKPVGPWPLPNVWLGTSVEDQQRADERIPHLLRCPAAVRWLSCEPLLGEVDLGLQSATCDCCARWPSRWVEVKQTVRPDPPLLHFPEHASKAVHPGVYRAVSNQHGALSIETPQGRLGIRPGEFEALPGLDWIVVGGESGPNSAPCDVRWIRSIVKQCQTAKVPVFVKQVGANPYQSRGEDGTPGFEIRLDSAKGGDPAEWAEDLRVRQMPGGAP